MAVDDTPKDDIDPAQDGEGNAEPKKPDNSPPKDDATAADDASSDGDAGKAGDTDGDDKDGDKQETAEDKPLDAAVWGTTGDEVGDSVLSLLQNSGMTVEDAKAILFDAVQAGDITKVDRASLEAKIGKEKAALVLAGTENFVRRAADNAKTIITEVHTTVGGEENWKAITAWANKSVSESDLAEYRDLINAGGAKARFAAAELTAKYNADASNTTIDASTAVIVGESKPNQPGRKTTKADYVSELEAAHKRGASDAEIAEINSARARGRAAGI